MISLPSLRPGVGAAFSGGEFGLGMIYRWSADAGFEHLHSLSGAIARKANHLTTAHNDKRSALRAVQVPARIAPRTCCTH